MEPDWTKNIIPDESLATLYLLQNKLYLPNELLDEIAQLIPQKKHAKLFKIGDTFEIKYIENVDYKYANFSKWCNICDGKLLINVDSYYENIDGTTYKTILEINPAECMFLHPNSPFNL
jgi:hypothetical protein